jgi:hypothetical protein
MIKSEPTSCCRRDEGVVVWSKGVCEISRQRGGWFDEIQTDTRSWETAQSIPVAYRQPSTNWAESKTDHTSLFSQTLFKTTNTPNQEVSQASYKIDRTLTPGWFGKSCIEKSFWTEMESHFFTSPLCFLKLVICIPLVKTDKVVLV